DSDMFLVQPFSIKDFLGGYEMAGIPQGYSKNKIEIQYLWIGISFLDMARLPEKELINFNCGLIEGVPVDAGGYTYHYIQKHPELRLRLFGALHSDNIFCSACRLSPPLSNHNRDFYPQGLDDEQINLLRSGSFNVEFICNGAFFHYRGGTNWDHQTNAFHEKKTHLFNE